MERSGEMYFEWALGSEKKARWSWRGAGVECGYKYSGGPASDATKFFEQGELRGCRDGGEKIEFRATRICEDCWLFKRGIWDGPVAETIGRDGQDERDFSLVVVARATDEMTEMKNCENENKLAVSINRHPTTGAGLRPRHARAVMAVAT